MRYIVETKDIHNFNYCPYCGYDFVIVEDGDYGTRVYCLECEDEMDLIILEEYRDRFPDKFNKLIRE